MLYVDDQITFQILVKLSICRQQTLKFPILLNSSWSSCMLMPVYSKAKFKSDSNKIYLYQYHSEQGMHLMSRCRDFITGSIATYNKIRKGQEFELNIFVNKLRRVTKLCEERATGALKISIKFIYFQKKASGKTEVVILFLCYFY